jgi:hypothetical protein
VIFAIVLGFLFYLDYRIIESRNDMASLKEQAAENDIMTVALVRAEPLPGSK